MKPKLKIIIPLAVLLALGGVYKVVLAKPAEKEKLKVDGVVYVLPKEFVLNLEGGRYAKLNVALVLDHEQATAPEEEAEGAPVEPPEGYGTLEQEGLVRSIVVDELTGLEVKELSRRKPRAKLKRELVEQLEKKTDVKVEEVLFTDVVVQ